MHRLCCGGIPPGIFPDPFPVDFLPGLTLYQSLLVGTGTASILYAAGKNRFVPEFSIICRVHLEEKTRCFFPAANRMIALLENNALQSRHCVACQ